MRACRWRIRFHSILSCPSSGLGTRPVPAAPASSVPLRLTARTKQSFADRRVPKLELRNEGKSSSAKITQERAANSLAPPAYRRTLASVTPQQDDPEARLALWRALLNVSERLAGRCAVFASRLPMQDGRLHGEKPPKSNANWQLVEALSLLAILLRADDILTPNVTNVFGKTGPIPVREDGKDRWIWTQPNLSGGISGLAGRPDILVTFSGGVPSPSTALRVIECKCREQIGAPLIRAEFGKAHDLRIGSYLIWSFYTPNKAVIEGAKSLGLDLVSLGFDTDRRGDLIGKPENLVAHVANTLEVSKRHAGFARAQLKAGEAISKKMTEM